MFLRFSVLSKYSRPGRQGFSLVELLVSISIIVLVLVVTLTRQGAYNSAVLLQSEAYDVALAIREAQTQGVSVTAITADEFRAVYGVHFDIANPDEYILFQDADDDMYYSDTSEVILGATKLDGRFEIKDITPAPDGDSVSIVFERPNFDAVFVEEDGGGGEMSSTVTSIEIQLGMVGVEATTCGQDYRIIEVTSVGQISVQECP